MSWREVTRFVLWGILLAVVFFIVALIVFTLAFD
jgi:hypothetical protein